MRKQNKLVDGDTLLDALFDGASRPSHSWLRNMRKNKKVPFVKAGRLIRYDIDKVRKALNS